MPINCKDPISLDNLCVAPSAQKTVTFRTLQQQYGDGYMARRQDGINPTNYTWGVSTPPMPFEDALALEEELLANGTGFFTWTPPNEADAYEFILDPVQWQWSFQSDSMASISFTLKRWYQ